MEWSEKGKVYIFNLNLNVSLKTLAVVRVASCLKKQLESGQDREKVLGLLEIPDTLKQEVGFYL